MPRSNSNIEFVKKRESLVWSAIQDIRVSLIYIYLLIS